MVKKNQVALPINLEEALNRIGGDEAFLKELLEIYRDEFINLSQQLEKAIELKNYSMIADNGHTLKGASANLSLPALREAAWEMEMAGKNQDLEAARKALTALKKEFHRLEKFLSEKNKN